MLSLCCKTFPRFIEYIVNTRNRLSALDGESILAFHWRASKVDGLSEQLDARLVKLDEQNIHRFEYDYKSETVYLKIMRESTLYFKVRTGLRHCIKN